MKLRTITLVMTTAMLLAACGETKSDRALSGGAIGAAGGALVGGTTGAVVGGAAGAAVGGLTDSNDINLGKPIWR